jgi:hypothetical protein
LYDAENIWVAPTAWEARREMIDAVSDLALRATAVRILRDKNFVPLTKEQIAEAEKFLTRLRLRPTRCRKRAPVVPRSGYAGSIPS